MGRSTRVPPMERLPYTKADYDYYIGVRCVLTNLFGSREVLAYVYDKVASYRNKSVHDFIFTLSE